MVVGSFSALLMLGCQGTQNPQSWYQHQSSSGNQKDGWFSGENNWFKSKKQASKPESLDTPIDPMTGKPMIRPSTHLAAGRLHESQGRPVAAVKQYQLALKEDVNNTDAWNRLGVVLTQLGKYRAGRNAFERAIDIAGEAAHLHNNIAYSYMLQNDWVNAQAYLTRALELSSDFPKARMNLALTLSRQKRFSEALTQFKLALPAQDAYYNIGLMYQANRKLAEAAAAYQKSLKLDPNMESAQQRLAKLPKDIQQQGKQIGDIELAARASEPKPQALAGMVKPASAPIQFTMKTEQADKAEQTRNTEQAEATWQTTSEPVVSAPAVPPKKQVTTAGPAIEIKKETKKETETKAEPTADSAVKNGSIEESSSSATPMSNKPEPAEKAVETAKPEPVKVAKQQPKAKPAPKTVVSPSRKPMSYKAKPTYSSEGKLIMGNRKPLKAPGASASQRKGPVFSSSYSGKPGKRD
jgi:Flp pilus assembly protein TadD